MNISTPQKDITTPYLKSLPAGLPSFQIKSPPRLLSPFHTLNKESHSKLQFPKTSMENPPQSNIDKTDQFFQSQTLHQSNQIKLSQSLKTTNTINNSNTSPQILGSVLDSNEKFSPNTPSNLKICQREIDNIQSSLNDNISNLTFKGGDPKTYLLNAIEISLTEIDSKENFDNITMQDKLKILLSYIEVDNRILRLGCLVLLYIFLRKFWEQTDDEIKTLTIDKIITILKTKYETQEELYLVSCLNICSLYGPEWTILIDNLGLISMFITDFNFPLLQRASFVCLMTLENDGIRALISLSLKDYQEYQHYILNSLLNTPHIQRMIIVRALVNELSSHSLSRVQDALSALNRMFNIISEESIINKIACLFYETQFKNLKLFIASILYGANDEYADYVLLSEFDNSKDPVVREVISKVFGHRRWKNPSYLQMRLDNNDTKSNMKNPPGGFCKYYGKISPIIGESDYVYIKDNNDTDDNDLIPIAKENKENNNKNINEYLEINTRDFLAALKRMLILNYAHHCPQIVNEGQSLNILDSIDFNIMEKNKDSNINSILFKYYDLLSSFPKEDNGESNYRDNRENSTNGFKYSYPNVINRQYTISTNIIKALSKHLDDPNAKVRVSCAISIGQISLPEAMISISSLFSILKKNIDVDLRAAIIWSIGKCADGISYQYIPIILKYLEHNMWKVKRATLFAISKFGERCANIATPILKKLFKETPINKQLVAEALVYLGHQGELELLNAIGKESECNFKIIGAVTRAFAFCNIESKNIDFIIESLFKQCNNASPFVRKNALYTLCHLSKKANESRNRKLKEKSNVIYLSYKNIIPFYYSKLKDKDDEIQKFALKCLKDFGPKGELILIEGLLKETNVLIRANCGVGLAEIGVHTLRTLINNGLVDQSEFVRKSIEKSIMKNMKIDDIIDYYENNNQLLSLKILFDDLIEKNNNIGEKFKSFSRQILSIIQVKEKDEIEKCEMISQKGNNYIE